MGVIWGKVWFDLWHNRLRTLLAVLSIAVGVFAVGAIFGMVDQALSSMDRAHQAVIPAHISMYLNSPISREAAMALKKVPGVDGVEPSNATSIRFKVSPEGKWEPGMVQMRDDYARESYDLLQIKAGRWPRGTDLAIERLASQFWRVDVGDQVILDMGKKERSFRITGLIRHPLVPPPQYGGPAYFFVDAEGMERFGIPRGQFGVLLIRIKPYSADYAKEVAAAIKDRLAKQDIGIATTIYQNPTEHWGRPMAAGMNLVMEVLAVVSLLLSVILVLNTLTALITQQTNQIGVLKAIGGTRGTIVQVYLAGVLAYGLLALGISLPLGVYAAHAQTRWFLNMYNIEYPGLAISQRALALQIIAALGVPLLAALWPVLQGAAVTVRQAMASYGLGGDFGSNRLDRAVERVGQRFLPTHYAMALANTFRRKGRLVLTQLVLVIAGGMFLIVMSVASSLIATLDTELGRRSYDVSIQFARPQRITRAAELAQSVGGVEKAEVWFLHTAAIAPKGAPGKARESTGKYPGLSSKLEGVPLDDPMYRPLIVAGRWLQPGDGRAIVMPEKMADDNQMKLGDTVTLDLGELGKDDWQIVGLCRSPLMVGDYLSADAIYAPRQAVLAATNQSGRGKVLVVRTRSESAADTTSIVDGLVRLYQRGDMKVYTSLTTPKLRESSMFLFLLMSGMLMTLALIMALVGGLGLMGSLSIGVIERSREIGVLRAIGARSRTIMRMFVLEGVAQGLLSWALAVPLSFILGRPLALVLGETMYGASLDYQYNYGAVLAWLAAVLAIASLASIVPARNAARVSIRQTLAYE